MAPLAPASTIDAILFCTLSKYWISVNVIMYSYMASTMERLLQSILGQVQELNYTTRTTIHIRACSYKNYKNSTTLQKLNLYCKPITCKGAEMISEAIKVNTTLHTLDIYQWYFNDALPFNMTLLTAVYHNNTLMKLRLPFVFGDKERLVSSYSEVERINEERTRQDISTLTCDCSWIHGNNI